MNRITLILLTLLGLVAGCSKSGVMSPGEFTKEYAETLGQASPGTKVVIMKDLELKVTSATGADSTAFLDNAYDAYKQDPSAKAQVMQRFIAAGLEAMNDTHSDVDRTRIVPVIKDRLWLEETRQTLLKNGAKKIPEHVYDEFSSDLVVVYAEDSPKTIRYITPEDLEKAKIDRPGLRQLACDNLRRILPKIERQGTNGLYMLTAGGDYEASLLLLDSIWTGGQMDVNGDIVVAIPTRDVLLVTGSKNPQGLASVKEMVKRASDSGSYRLTTKLFVYRNGRFEEFKE